MENSKEKKENAKKYISKNIYINKDNNSDNSKFRIIKLSSLAYKIAFTDGFFPAVKTVSIMNKVRITIEGSDLVANVSKRTVDNIISLIIGIIVSIYNNKENNSNNKDQNNMDRNSVEVSSYLMGSNGTNGSQEERTCIEQVLLKKIESELKKVEIKIQNVKVNLYSDNFIYKYLTILLNNLKIERNSFLYVGSNINNDLHLSKI